MVNSDFDHLISSTHSKEAFHHHGILHTKPTSSPSRHIPRDSLLPMPIRRLLFRARAHHPRPVPHYARSPSPPTARSRTIPACSTARCSRTTRLLPAAPEITPPRPRGAWAATSSGAAAAVAVAAAAAAAAGSDGSRGCVRRCRTRSPVQ
jgi:hypothetical protein